MRRLVLCGLFILMFLSACSMSPNKITSSGASAASPAKAGVSAVSEKPSPTPSPVKTPAKTPTPTPTLTPTATPEPSPTPTPFSAYAPTVKMSFDELVGDDGYNKPPKGFPAKDTYKIIVDIYHQVVMVYTKDTSGEYTVPVRYMLCSTGLNGATPKGTFKMHSYHVRFGLFTEERLYGQYWTQIRGRIYFHTMLYKKRDASSYIDETYESLGKPDSHGCIRLTAPDARWIYYNAAPGTIVVIQKGSEDDTATALIRSQLILAPLPEERVTLEKGKIPNTDNWSIPDIPFDVKFRQGSQS